MFCSCWQAGLWLQNKQYPCSCLILLCLLMGHRMFLLSCSAGQSRNAPVQTCLHWGSFFCAYARQVLLSSVTFWWPSPPKVRKWKLTLLSAVTDVCCLLLPAVRWKTRGKEKFSVINILFLTSKVSFLIILRAVSLKLRNTALVETTEGKTSWPLLTWNFRSDDLMDKAQHKINFQLLSEFSSCKNSHLEGICSS